MKTFLTALGLLFCVTTNAANPPIVWGSPYAKLLTKGIQTSGSDTTTTCVAGLAGSIRYNAGTFEGCDGSTWTSLGGGGGGGVTTMGTFGSSPDAKGASISGVTLTMQPADGTHPGEVTTGTQTIAGAKTFSTSVKSPAFISSTASPASLGIVELANTDEIRWRNALNNGDKSLTLDSGNIFQFTSPITSSGNITATGTIVSTTPIALASGGTSASTKAGAFDALSPMSASGDIIYGGASGTGTRLVKGSDGQYLKLASGLPSWAALAGSMSPTQVLETVIAGGTCSTSYNFDPTTGTMLNLTLNGACAIGVTNLAAGHSFTIKLTQSSTVAPTFTSAYKWALATPPTWSTSATKYDMVACVSLDGTTLDCSGIVDVR